MNDFDAHLDLAKRADAARRCGCADELDAARGIFVCGPLLSLVAFIIAVVVIVLLEVFP